MNERIAAAWSRGVVPPEGPVAPANEFEAWLQKQDAFSLPLVAWGPSHTEIALRFARDFSAGRARLTLDEALNSGDGSYKP